MNHEQAHINMIGQQLRPWNVSDAKVLALLQQVPREDFVQPQYTGLAYADLELPLGYGEMMMVPRIEGRIVQALALKETDSVLEIGTGSGYMTALLAKLAKHVYSVERIKELSAAATGRLRNHNIDNVTLDIGDGAQGWAAHAPYDVIVLTGSVPVLASAFRDSLNIGGRLLAVIGEAPAMEATLITRVSADSFLRKVILETCVPQLVGAVQPEHFVF